jgi:ankyrin repeat protein
MIIKVVVSVLIFVGMAFSIKKYIDLKKIGSDNKYSYLNVLSLFLFWLLLLVFQITAAIEAAVVAAILLLLSIVFKRIYVQTELSELSGLIDNHRNSLPPIERAIAKRSIDELKEALQDSKAKRFSDDLSSTYLEDAINKNWHDGLEFLLMNGVNPNVESSSGEKMLLYPLKSNNHDAARLLLKGGANTDIPEEENDHLLFYAIEHDLEYLIAESLDQGVNPNMRDEEGHTPLTRAVATGNFGAVKLLVAHGADPNIGSDFPYEGDHEFTSIDSAVENNQIDILKYLLENGAKLEPDDINRLVGDKESKQLTEAQKYILQLHNR